MGSILCNLLFAVIWYGVLSVWLWLIIGSIRSGDAGASGMPMDSKNSPIRFWFRIALYCMWWMVFATLPFLLILKYGVFVK